MRPAFDAARAARAHTGLMRRAVADLKFRGGTGTAAILSTLMAREIEQDEHYAGLDLIVPVPVHYSRLRDRPYNQALLLAQALGRRLDLPVSSRLLRKVRPTPPQVGLSRAKRLLNVKGAFAVTAKGQAKIDGKAVLLVDDVMTTGATAHECAKALRMAGAHRVVVLTAARAI